VANPVDRLAAEDLPCLFDRFWRKDAARSGTTHAGLGLSLSRAFAIRLGYALAASLDAAQGLTMSLSGPDRPARSQAGSPGSDVDLLPAHRPSGS